MRPLRVLHVVQNLNYGGMERLIAEISSRSDPERYEMHVLVLQYTGRFARDLEDRVGIHQAPPMSKLSLLRPARLAGTIRSLAPDVVHSHSGVWNKASHAARIAGVLAVVHTDHGRTEETRWIDRFLDRRGAGRTDVVVAVSDELARRLRRDVVGPRTRVEVIRNGVDTDVFRPAGREGTLAGELDLEPERPILGSIGRLEPVKGYDVMIRAFARLLGESGHGVRPALVIAGDGSQRTPLEALVRELDVRDDAHLLGWRDDIQNLHAGFDLFTMSSHSEGTSVSLLEAMSAGICPVVTEVGGNSTVLGPDLAHRLVPPDHPDLLASAWADALSDPGARREDGRRARERVKAAYDVRSMVTAYGRIYREVVAGASEG